MKMKHRKKQILDGALNAAAAHGYTNMSRAQVADASGCSAALVSHYFGTMTQLRRAVMRHAVSCERLSVIAQGLALKDPQALKAPEELRRLTIESFRG